MKKIYQVVVILCFSFFSVNVSGQDWADLKIYIIRHGEKPADGDNLNCKGLNRSLQLPPILYKKMGIPNFIYVPSLGLSTRTSHSRMFQTVTPFAAKYNLRVNSLHPVKDCSNLAADVKGQRGTVLIVWEHKALTDIVKALGVPQAMKWDDSDFDSIWLVTIKEDGTATLTKDAEGLHPQDDCTF